MPRIGLRQILSTSQWSADDHSESRKCCVIPLELPYQTVKIPLPHHLHQPITITIPVFSCLELFSYLGLEVKISPYPVLYLFCTPLFSNLIPLAYSANSPQQQIAPPDPAESSVTSPAKWDTVKVVWTAARLHTLPPSRWLKREIANEYGERISLYFIIEFSLCIKFIRQIFAFSNPLLTNLTYFRLAIAE